VSSSARYYSSKKPEESEQDQGQEGQEQEQQHELDELFNRAPETAVFSIVKANVGLRVGFFNNSVFLQMAHPREGLPKNRDINEGDFDWPEAKIFVLLNVYDTAKVLAVLEGYEKRANLITRVDDEGGVAAFDQAILLTRSSEAASSAATDTKSWRSLYTLSISLTDLQQNLPPLSGIIHLDAGDVLLMAEHFRRSLITLFGFTHHDNKNPFDVDPDDFEEVLKTQPQFADLINQKAIEIPESK
jgi:hypothetical protein